MKENRMPTKDHTARTVALSRRGLFRSAPYAAAGALGAAGVLAGCTGTSSGTPDPKATLATQPANVSVQTSSGAPEAEAFKTLFDAFGKRYPHITIEYTAVGGGGPQYNERLMSLIAAGSAPDVFKTAPFGFGQLAHAGAYVALGDYVKRFAGEVKAEDFFPSHIEGCKYKGTLYALPQSGAPQGMWLNLDHWQREGLSIPSWDSTWADLLKAGTALTKRDATGITTQMGMGRPDWLSWVWSAGGDLYNAEGTKMLIDQPPALEALTWLQDLVQRHRVAPNAQELADKTLTSFPSGTLGIQFANRGALGMNQSIDSFTYDAAPLPKGPKGRVAQTAVGITSIWSGSRARDAGFTVMNYMCGFEGQSVFLKGGTAHASRKSVTQEPWFKDFRTARAASTRINTVFPETLTRNEARASTPHPHEAEINQVVTKNLDALWSGGKSPKEVAAGIVAEASSLLVK